MSLEKFIDNERVNNRLQTIYKTANNNDIKLIQMFDDIYTELSPQFTNIIKEDNCIKINIDDTKLIKDSVDNVRQCVKNHTSGINNKYDISGYIFNVINTGNTITITKR